MINDRYLQEYTPEELQDFLNSKLKRLQCQVTKKSKRIILVVPYNVIPGRDDNWLEETRKSYRTDRDFRQEQGNSWTTYAGQPVISNYRPEIHHVGYPGVLRNRPLRLSFDWGGQFAAYRITQETREGNWIWHTQRTLVKSLGDEVDPDEMCLNLKKRFQDSDDRYYHPTGWDFEIVIDVSGSYENPQGFKNKRGESIALDTVKFHFPKAKIKYDKIPIIESYKGLDKMFRQLKAGRPAIILSSDPAFQRMLQGGWHFPKDKRVGGQHDIPEDDGIWIHPGDLARYEWWNWYYEKRKDDAPEPARVRQKTYEPDVSCN